MKFQTDVFVVSSIRARLQVERVQLHTGLAGKSVRLPQVTHPRFDGVLELAGRKSVVDESPFFRAFTLQTFSQSGEYIGTIAADLPFINQPR